MRKRPKYTTGSYTMTGNMLDVFVEDGQMYLFRREPRTWIPLPSPRALAKVILDVLDKDEKK